MSERIHSAINTQVSQWACYMFPRSDAHWCLMCCAVSWFKDIWRQHDHNHQEQLPEICLKGVAKKFLITVMNWVLLHILSPQCTVRKVCHGMLPDNLCCIIDVKKTVKPWNGDMMIFFFYLAIFLHIITCLLLCNLLSYSELWQL